jgi:hypothetical protein
MRAPPPLMTRIMHFFGLQAFCRVAAVAGAVHVLRCPVEAPLCDEHTFSCIGVELGTGQVLTWCASMLPFIGAAAAAYAPECWIEPALAMQGLAAAALWGNVEAAQVPRAHSTWNCMLHGCGISVAKPWAGWNVYTDTQWLPCSIPQVIRCQHLASGEEFLQEWTSTFQPSTETSTVHRCTAILDAPLVAGEHQSAVVIPPGALPHAEHAVRGLALSSSTRVCPDGRCGGEAATAPACLFRTAATLGCCAHTSSVELAG